MEKKVTISKVIIYIILTIIMFFTLYPIIYVVSMSFSSAQHILMQDVWLLPKELSIDSYKVLFKNTDIWVAYWNTIVYTVLGTAIGLVATVMISYAISQKKFRYRRVVTWFVMITMFFSGGIIPTYILMNQLHLINTIWAIVLPSAVTAWNVIIGRTYFASLPGALIESARIDGAGEIRILWDIIVPISKPIIAVLALYMIVGYWNTYFNALLYLDDSSMHPLQNYLQKILCSFDFAGAAAGGGSVGIQTSQIVEQLKYSSIVVAMFPIMCIYPFLQKYFVKGIMIGSIKE